jgi:hypothetical protein
MRTIGSVILSALVVALLAGSLGAQTAAPANSAPAAETPAALVPVLKAIREANSIAEAAAAYSGTAEEDHRNVELNTAYMRRLLQLGQPQAAGIPAAALASIPVNDGMAFGVLGYNAGRQNDLAKALTNTMKAAGLLKDDTSIQNNLGQLVAWNENDKTFKLPATDQPALDRLKTEMATQPAYMSAYEAVKDGYDKFNDANSQNQQKIASAEADVTAAQKKITDDQAQIKGLQDEEANDVKARSTLQAQPTGGGTGTGTGGGRTGGGARPGRGPMAGGNAAQIQQLTAAINDIDTKRMPAAKKTLQDDTTALNQKQQALAKAKGTPLSAVPLAKLFYWLPPAVDGVVTMPPGTTSRPTSAPASTPAAAGG